MPNLGSDELILVAAQVQRSTVGLNRSPPSLIIFIPANAGKSAGVMTPPFAGLEVTFIRNLPQVIDLVVGLVTVDMVY
jgi:hypothetical protein